MKKILAVLCSLMMIVSLAACSSTNTGGTATETTEPTSGNYTAGTYEGVGHGHNGDVKVSVTVTNDAISSVEVTEQNETPTLSDRAIEQIPADIVTYQSLGVDTVSGATFTSNAIINGATDALKQAGADTDVLKAITCNYPAEATDDMTTDVLVLGGGTSGMMAAYTAAKEGKQVVLVEKEGILGGTLNVAAGLLLTVDSESNDATIDDSLNRVEEFYQNVNQDSVHSPEYDFTWNLMSQTGATVDELIALGMDHTDLDMGNYAGTIFTAGHKLSADLQKACTDAGVTILTDTAATELNTDESGAVIGAVVTNKTGSYTINAKATIVTCGGASYSEDLKNSEAALATVDLNEKTAVGSTADGFHLLENVGAAMSEDVYVKSSQPDFAQVFGTNWSNTPSTAMTFMIDAEGNRFTNEGPAADTILNKHMIDHASSAYWNIIDENNTIGFDADLFASIKEEAANDNVKVAVYGATLEELATKLGVDPTVLQATLDKYNEGCAAGSDEFGKDATNCVAYPTEGGYYAAYRRIGSWGTIGGAIVDENQHVLDSDGNIIPGVFAAGETATSQLFGDYYFGGFSLGLYTTAGRIAGSTAAAEVE